MYSIALSPCPIPRRPTLIFPLTQSIIMESERVSVPVVIPDEGVGWVYLTTPLLFIFDMFIILSLLLKPWC